MMKMKIFWNRFQISSDRQIFRICSILKKEGHIFHLFVDKNHVTNIVKDNGDHPIAVNELESFSNIFSGDQHVAEIVSQHEEDYQLEEMEVYPVVPASTEAVDEPIDGSPTSELNANPGGNIIDVDD